MTNEEAKSELMQIYGMLSEEKKKALDVLMTQADGEYISRQDAIDACLNGWNKDYKEIVADIRQLPTVAIPNKVGYWIFKSNMWWKCSECGCYVRIMKKYNTPNYCPACGAKMKEGDHTV